MCFDKVTKFLCRRKSLGRPFGREWGQLGQKNERFKILENIRKKDEKCKIAGRILIARGMQKRKGGSKISENLISGWE